MGNSIRAFATAALVCLASAAHATTQNGVPNLVQAPGTLGTCAIFQIGNLNQTFSIQSSDANFEDEFALVTLASTLKLPITFTDAGVTNARCQNYEVATDFFLGNVQCPTGFQFDFTMACDSPVIAAVR